MRSWRKRFKKAVHNGERHVTRISHRKVRNLEKLQMDIEHDMKMATHMRKNYRSFDDDENETREIEARLEELLLRKEKETATPLEYGKMYIKFCTIN